MSLFFLSKWTVMGPQRSASAARTSQTLFGNSEPAIHLMEITTMFLRFTPVAMIRSLRDRKTVADGNRTPPDHRPLDRTRARLRLEALEERCLLSGIPGFAEFPAPVRNINNIAAGPDGNLWFNGTLGYIGTINPTTDAVTQFPLLTANDYPNAITAGPDGNVWFTGFNGSTSFIGMINPASGAVSEFTLPPPVNSSPEGITAGPDGNLWFTEQGVSQVGMINPTTHAISVFATPTPQADPQFITAGPDGNLWFTERANLGVINPTTHVITEFPIDFGPSGITTGPDGNLWFGSHGGQTIGEINPTTHAIAEFTTPTAGSGTGAITSGLDGNLWFTEYNVGQIGTINPTTHVITEFSDTYTGSEPDWIASGSDGNLWFGDPGTHAIGVAIVNAPQLVVTQAPPAILTAGNGFGLTVDAEDSSGNLVSSFNGTVTVALASNTWAALGGTLSVQASGGVATFSGLTLNKAGSGYTLAVTSAGIGEAITSAITVTPAAPSQVVIGRQPPASVTAGSAFFMQAAIEDPFGNVVTSASNTVTLALANNPGGSTLGGTLSVTPSGGVVTFSGLTLKKAGSGYTFQASSSGLSSATTSAMTVTPAAATQVVITKQPPSSVVVNSGFGLQASVEDAYGNVVTSASNTVKMVLASNPSGSKLGGTLSVKASNGVAAFSGLTLNKVGSGYTLQVSSSGLGGATTSAITVTNTAAIILAAATVPASAPDPLLAPLVLDSPDLSDSVVLKKRVRLA